MKKREEYKNRLENIKNKNKSKIDKEEKIRKQNLKWLDDILSS